MCLSVYVSCAYTMPRELDGFKAHIHNNAIIHTGTVSEEQ